MVFILFIKRYFDIKINIVIGIEPKFLCLFLMAVMLRFELKSTSLEVVHLPINVHHG